MRLDLHWCRIEGFKSEFLFFEGCVDDKIKDKLYASYITIKIYIPHTI